MPQWLKSVNLVTAPVVRNDPVILPTAARAPHLTETVASPRRATLTARPHVRRCGLPMSTKNILPGAALAPGDGRGVKHAPGINPRPRGRREIRRARA